jgi:L-ascorbate metabolism protein UlaG (beta-lactamase superfamily)
MKALRDVDIAFVAVNQPYTMTPQQAVEAVKALQPKIFYPYHYGQVDEPTDVEALARMLQDIVDVRIRPLA